MSDEMISKLIERIDKKFYGKYRGQVVDNQDPLKRGRIRAKVQNLLDDQETGWCESSVPFGGMEDYGFFMVPEVGSSVWIEFEAGDLSMPIWSGVWYSSNSIPSEAKGTVDPSKKIIKTKKGHIIMFDDTDGNEKIIIQDKTQNNLIEIDSVQNSLKIISQMKLSLKANIVEIEAETAMSIKAGTTLTIQGAIVKIN